MNRVVCLRGLLLLLCLLALTPSAGVAAEETGDVDVGAGDSDFVDLTAGHFERVDSSGGAAAGGTARPAGAPAYTGPTMVAPPELRTAPDGSRCVYMRSIPGDPTSSQALANQRAIEDMMQLYGQFCPESPMDTPEQPTPGAVAARLWAERVVLPSPSVWIAPGSAITGMPVYLEIGGEREPPPVVFGPEVAAGFTIRFDLTSTYDIDWGDGAVLLEETRQGGPYPSGDLRHVYQDRSDGVLVRVVQRWTATWSATGPVSASGSIEGELYTEGSMPLRVEEIQAVVTYRE